MIRGSLKLRIDVAADDVAVRQVADVVDVQAETRGRQLLNRLRKARHQHLFHGIRL
jgi:hypothetical protein